MYSPKVAFFGECIHQMVKLPVTFSKAYPHATFEVISRENFTDFVTAN